MYLDPRKLQAKNLYMDKNYQDKLQSWEEEPPLIQEIKAIQTKPNVKLHQKSFKTIESIF